MNLKTLKCALVSKFKSSDDIRHELQSVKSLREKHELLSRSLKDWKRNVEQSNSQLDILDDTAFELRGKHKCLMERLQRTASTGKDNPALLRRLKKEVNAMELQLDLWIREICDVSEDRTRLNVQYALEYLQLKSGIQRSVTNVGLALCDADKLEKEHIQNWENFLQYEEHSQKKPKESFK